MNQYKWVLALSIDDEITWAVAPVSVDSHAPWKQAYPQEDFLCGKFADVPNWNETDRRNVPVSILIREGLQRLSRDPHIQPFLAAVEAVGISSIGLVDRNKGQLVDLRRKDWKWENRNYVIDFVNLFRKTLPRLVESNNGVRPIAVHNDGTAKCMAFRQRDGLPRKSDVLCLVMVNDGVNIGVANAYGPMSSHELHPEMGHAYPVLSLLDGEYRTDLVRYSGCPIHTTCFEGLASGARIRKQWGVQYISDVPDRKSRPDRPNDRQWALSTIPSYIAHLCWSSTLALAPTRILVGGTSVCDLLVDQTRDAFTRLNRGTDRPYLSDKAYTAMKKMNSYLMRAAPFTHPVQQGIKDMNGLMGALALGRHAALGYSDDMVRSGR